MDTTKTKLTIISGLLTLCFITGCSSSDDDAVINTNESSTPCTTLAKVVDVNPILFAANALVESVAVTSCTLNNGTSTQCYELTIAGVPANYDIGSFCPRDIYATADEVGIWFDGSGEVYDIDGEFILNLATLYNDPNWQLYDPTTGLVNYTSTLEACDGAARPNVAPEYQNHCVECSLDYVGGGVSATYVIPITPVLLSSASSVGRDDIGLTLNGVTLAAPAPVDAILGAYTIAAFDDCAGHINPVAGYHYHGSAGCSEIITEDDGHESMFGYALDGFGIYGMRDEQGNEATDLDTCDGHSDDTRGYHYHAASVAENMFIECFSGATAR